MAAQRCADQLCPFRRDPAQTAILFQKSPDRFPVVAFSDIKAFNFFPKGDRGVVIVDREFASLNLHLFCGLLFRLLGCQTLRFAAPRRAFPHVISSAIVSHKILI